MVPPREFFSRSLPLLHPVTFLPFPPIFLPSSSLLPRAQTDVALRFANQSPSSTSYSDSSSRVSNQFKHTFQPVQSFASFVSLSFSCLVASRSSTFFCSRSLVSFALLLRLVTFCMAWPRPSHSPDHIHAHLSFSFRARRLPLHSAPWPCCLRPTELRRRALLLSSGCLQLTMRRDNLRFPKSYIQEQRKGTR